MSTNLSGLELIHHCNPNYSLTLLKDYNFTYSIASMVTLLLIIALLVAMVFYKTYQSTLKRLFLYLTLSIMVYVANSSTNLQLQPEFFNHTHETFCKWTGYIETCAFVATLILTFEISLYLLFVVYYQIRVKPIPVPTRPQTIGLEVTGLFVAVVLPTCLLSIPLKHFGTGAAVCWVKLYDNTTSCEPPPGSVTLEKVLFTVYTFFIVVNLTAFVVLFIVFIRLACKFQQSRTQYVQTAVRTITLFIFLAVYGIVHLSAIIVPFYMMANPKSIWRKGIYLHLVLDPISQFFRPLAYMFYLNSVKKFRWEETKMAAVEWRRTWRFCCLRCWHRMRGDKGTVVNDLDGRSCEYLTPSVMTSTHYESLGRTSVE